VAKTLRTTSALAGAVMILVGACGSSASPSPAASTPAASAPAASAPAASAPAASAPAPSAAAALNLPAVPTGYKELDQALGSDKPFNGKKVSIQTQWTGGEGEGFAAAIKDFAATTGIAIQVDSIGSSHETVLKTRIEGGSPPDMAALAQPTGVLAYAAEGKVKDIAAIVGPEGAAKLKAEFPSTIGLTSEGDHIWSIPTKADVKSMIWYPVKAFAAKGYAVPKTWDELVALADKIVADGSHPFCVSAGGPGTATGWELTDWVEEVLLKTEDPQVTNDWVSGKIKFTDPKIKAAFDKVGSLLFKDKYVDGGGQAIVNADLKTVMDPMFNQDTAAPGCWMQKIPTWYGPDFFPDQRTTGQPSKYVIGQDIGIFPFPTIDPAQNGSEGSGDTLLMMKDRPEVRAAAEFLATPEGLENWIRAGSAISANNKTPADWYAGSYKLKVAADIVSKSSFIGFDASDLMPASVGAGTFWTQAVDWANSNGTNTDAVLKAIDASWPTQ
jgi:alpha-glucoside transport system substrate-binding protein